eukprot:m.172972 g.172972  ORF g.172972 m.172972 type:complete len:413 (+) comp17866_c0_seq4:6314-7552(+)
MKRRRLDSSVEPRRQRGSSALSLLLPTNNTPFDPLDYAGFLRVHGREWPLSVTGTTRPWDPTAVVVRCSPQLRRLLVGTEAVVAQRLRQSASLSDFLVELHDVVRRVLAQTLDADNPTTAAFTSAPRTSTGSNAFTAGLELLGARPTGLCTTLVRELDDVGWSRVRGLDASLSVLDLVATDRGGRQHHLRLRIPPQYPTLAPGCVADLPAAFEPTWSGSSCSLSSIVAQFESALERYQAFWQALQTFDEDCWVLEPINPSFGSTTRRIAIGNHSSLQIDFDPLKPLHPPARCLFLGPDHVVNPLREQYYSGLASWDPSADLVTNLQNLLGFELPTATTASKDDFSVECGICYSFRLDDSIPDKVCDDPRCSRPFHRSCLYDWLAALPDAQQSFLTVFGTCPYCEHAISVQRA